jgi:hypothetical protein
MEQKLLVSAIILKYNYPQSLRACVLAVQSQSYVLGLAKVFS